MADTDLADIRDDISTLLQRTAHIEALMSTEAQRCPYREDIARAANNGKRLAALEGVVTDLRLQMAKIGVVTGALSGTAGGIVTALIMQKIGS